MEQAFDEVQEMNQRWLMRELVHQSDAPEGDGPGYAFFPTCRLKDGASRMSHRATEKAWSEAMEKVAPQPILISGMPGKVFPMRFRAR